MSRNLKSPLFRNVAKSLDLPMVKSDTFVPAFSVKKSREFLEESFSLDEINELVEIAKSPRKPKMLLDEYEVKMLEGRRSRKTDEKLVDELDMVQSKQFSEANGKESPLSQARERLSLTKKNNSLIAKKKRESGPKKNTTPTKKNMKTTI
ncbi:hypothetical protein EIN_173700 [Entamoeba invadens IP1]|uniref:Uncharacterized protein n=1 Tax=Entamoeba invadens IP1 TaxID=370355 RepID=A0A0A1TYQ2_ENTIV|nr:hypothetical protein EIN_173700 [Entamoeba invadens IP1]ELP84695.1 hypothetical protein EIN_173700 [Entamoeba invadens IP1]|eukprot:XP_004184041.1 hypothetical protein EIN_173700 [Entamoeba invadens IP1]